MIVSRVLTTILAILLITSIRRYQSSPLIRDVESWRGNTVVSRYFEESVKLYPGNRIAGKSAVIPVELSRYLMAFHIETGYWGHAESPPIHYVPLEFSIQDNKYMAPPMIRLRKSAWYGNKRMDSRIRARSKTGPGYMRCYFNPISCS